MTEPADSTSDPAKDDSVGSDWTDEGGATPTGPATAVDHAADADDDDADGDDG